LEKSSLKVQVVQVDNDGRSLAGFIVTLKALPPTTWWRCGDWGTPGLTNLGRSVSPSLELSCTYGSRRSVTNWEQEKRRRELALTPPSKSAAVRAEADNIANT
jgi:hypothetical protein